MTEQEWNNCKHPTPMLAFLRGRGDEDQRKLRLFAVACCRRVWRLLDDERSRRAVEVAELYADGRVNAQELQEAHDSAWQVWGTPARTAASDASVYDWRIVAAETAISHAAWATPGRTRAGERQAQAELLRDIFGPLLFRHVTLDPAWLAWHDGLIASMARQMYESRDFSNMPILADALEEAGCTNAEILNHGRQPGEHVRSCWVVDLVLGKE